MSDREVELQQLSPNVMVADGRETVEFYEDVLGFELAMAVPETEDEVFAEQRGDR